MADNHPPERLESPASIPKVMAPSQYRLSYRGRWLVIAAVAGLFAWCLIIYLAVQLWRS